MREAIAQLERRQSELQAELKKARDQEKRIEQLNRENVVDSDVLASISPKIEELKQAVIKLEKEILQAGGAQYKQKKEDLERATERCSEVEKSITRIRACLSSTQSNLLRFDSEIDQKKQEKTKLEASNNKIKQQIENNTQIGQNLVLQIGEIEDKKQKSREALKSSE